MENEQEREDRIAGSKDLAFDAIHEVTDLVERTHRNTSDKVFRRIEIARPIAPFARLVKKVHDGISLGVYSAIRGTGQGLRASAQLIPVPDKSRITSKTEEPNNNPPGKAARFLNDAQAALNGAFGDYLAKKKNGLAIPMSLRVSGSSVKADGTTLATHFSKSNGDVCVFVHGLTTDESSWDIGAEEFYGNASSNFGSMLNEELKFTPLYVRYNTGLHISENGRKLAALLQQLHECFPVPVKRLVLVGHSMGGLVSRSAVAIAMEDNAPWLASLDTVICIGSPHLGAPLEKVTNVVSGVLGRFDTAGTQVPKEVLNSRSSGIKDLRFGYTVDEEWQNRDPDAFFQDERQSVPMAPGVDYYFIAATVTKDTQHPVGVLLGDLMVRVASATGQTTDPDRRIPFTRSHVFAGINHLHLANHPDVYAVIRQAVAPKKGG